MSGNPADTIKRMARNAALKSLRYRDALMFFEGFYIAEALAAESGSKTRAAERLGVKRETLSRRLRRSEQIRDEG